MTMPFRDRMLCALIGAGFGAAIGFAVFWLLDVYSNTFGAGVFATSPRLIIGVSTSLFAVIGFCFGSRVGDAAGAAVSAILQVEGATDGEGPRWLWVAVLVVAVIVVLWGLIRHS